MSLGDNMNGSYDPYKLKDLELYNRNRYGSSTDANGVVRIGIGANGLESTQALPMTPLTNDQMQMAQQSTRVAANAPQTSATALPNFYLDPTKKNIYTFKEGSGFLGTNWGAERQLNLNAKGMELLRAAGGDMVKPEIMMKFAEQYPDLLQTLNTGGADAAMKTRAALQSFNKAQMNNTMSTTDKMNYALQGIQTAWNMYQGYQGLKLAKANFKETKALNHANFRNQALMLNNSIRDKHRGRGFVGMSSSAREATGRQMKRELVKEDY